MSQVKEFALISSASVLMSFFAGQGRASNDYFARASWAVRVRGRCNQMLTLFFVLFLNFLFCIRVQLINNVVTVSSEQRRDSAIHTHVSILAQTPLPSRLPYNIKQSCLCYTVGLCWLTSDFPFAFHFQSLELFVTKTSCFVHFYLFFVQNRLRATGFW